MAKRMRIPVYHMEAGNRCFDENVPGGDQPAPRRPRRRLQPRLHRARPTQPARRGPAPAPDHRDRVADARGARALPAADRGLRRRSTGSGSTPGGYFLVSAHREENVDSPERLRHAAGLPERRARALGPAGRGVHPPAHPQAPRGARRGRRGRRRSASSSRSASTTTTACSWTPPACSPTAARSPRSRSILGFPAITLRDSIERPEALDAGSIMMTGLDADDVRRAVGVAIDDGPVTSSMPPATRSATPATAWSASSCPPQAATTRGRESARQTHGDGGC